MSIQADELRGKLTAEQVEKAIHDCSTYASYDGVQYYASGIRLQAIADELNATLGNGTCKPTEENSQITNSEGRALARALLDSLGIVEHLASSLSNSKLLDGDGAWHFYENLVARVELELSDVGLTLDDLSMLRGEREKGEPNEA